MILSYFGSRDAVPIVAIIAGVVWLIARSSIQARAQQEQQDRRSALVEKALSSGALDEETKKELLAVLIDRPGHRHLAGSAGTFWTRAHLVWALGWVGLFVGLGLMLAGDPPTFQAGVIVGLASFGVLSVPFAMRELETRTLPGPVRRRPQPPS